MGIILRKIFLWMRAYGLSIRNYFRGREGMKWSGYPEIPSGLEFCPSRKNINRAFSLPASCRYDQSESDVSSWQVAARSKLKSLLKLERLSCTTVKVEPRPDLSGFDRKRIFLNFAPEQDCPIDVIERRFEHKEELPLMICMQGYNSGAHLSLGEIALGFDVYKVKSGSAIALQAADLGFRVISYERPCFGERRETRIRKPMGNPTIDAAFSSLMVGNTLIGETVSEISSLIDWACNEFDGCKNGIFLCGYSAAGTAAIFASAVDERINGIAIGGCVGQLKETVMQRGTGGFLAIPGILQHFEFDSILGLIAPRICVVVSGVSDHIYPYAGADLCMQSARRVYSELGASEAIVHLEASGGHTYYPELLWPAFMGAITRNS